MQYRVHSFICVEFPHYEAKTSPILKTMEVAYEAEKQMLAEAKAQTEGIDGATARIWIYERLWYFFSWKELSRFTIHSGV